MSWTRRDNLLAMQKTGGGPTARREQVRLIYSKCLWVTSLLTGLQPSVIAAGGKTQDIAWARMITVALVRRFSPYSSGVIADAVGIERSTGENATQRVDALVEHRAVVADVWRDAKRILTLEVQHAANAGLLDAYQGRHRDHPHPAWAGAADHMHPVRADCPQDAERPDAAGDRREEVQAGGVETGSETSLPGLHTDAEDT